jgi:hypothetical protein
MQYTTMFQYINIISTNIKYEFSKIKLNDIILFIQNSVVFGITIYSYYAFVKTFFNLIIKCYF